MLHMVCAYSYRCGLDFFLHWTAQEQARKNLDKITALIEIKTGQNMAIIEHEHLVIARSSHSSPHDDVFAHTSIHVDFRS